MIIKVNSIYENMKELEGREEGVKGAFMTFTFLGFYDKKRNGKEFRRLILYRLEFRKLPTHLCGREIMILGKTRIKKCF